MYKVCQRLFHKEDELALSRKNKLRHAIRRRAFKRFLHGCPLRKSRDISIGDAFKWEWMVYSDMHASAPARPALLSAVSVLFKVAGRIVAGIILVGTILAPQEIVNAAGLTSQFNIEAQTACEADMLGKAGAREVFSGKAYDALTEIARAYGRAIPHIYVFPGGWNMAYIAASTAVDGRGKILVGQQAIELFDTIALKGFLGHEMAHLVSDRAAQGCNDYILRDPRMEADADALAARTLGRRPVKAFLERVQVLTEGQNWDTKRRLEVLQMISINQRAMARYR